MSDHPKPVIGGERKSSAKAEAMREAKHSKQIHQHDNDGHSDEFVRTQQPAVSGESSMVETGVTTLDRSVRLQRPAVSEESSTAETEVPSAEISTSIVHDSDEHHEERVLEEDPDEDRENDDEYSEPQDTC